MNENNYPSIDILFLNEKDLIKCGVKNMKNCIDKMEEHFSLIGKGDYRMGGLNGNEHGLSYKEAVKLIVKANFQKIIDRINDEELKNVILKEIDKKLD